MLKIILFILSILPLVFQFVCGNKAISGNTKLKLWQVGIISCAGQVLVTFINLGLMSYFIEKAKSHNGLPFIGVVIISMVAGTLVLLVILVQTVVCFRKSIKLKKCA